MIDLVEQINTTHRSLGDLDVADGPGRSVLLRRNYAFPVEALWDACTDPARLSRWMGPVSGNLRPGGSFQVEGNAGGEILLCEEPRLLRVTWVLGEGMATEVEVRLSSGNDGSSELELEHTTPAAVLDELVRSYGPGGTIGIGTGWDIALLGLSLLLDGVEFDPTAWEDSPEVKAYAVGCCTAWGEVVQTAWEVSDDDLAAAVAFAASNFAPETSPRP
ncbi:MAG: SRPBCC domain-containing protein [Ornithinimicrobium sp.]